MPGQTVGRVTGTEDSTPLLFSVGLAPEQYLQLDDVVVTHGAPVPGRRGRRDLGRGHRGPSPATRARRSARTSSSSPTACCPRTSRRSPRSPPPASSRSATCRRARARRPGARPARSARRRCTSTRWTARCRSGSGRDGAADLRQPRVPRRHPRRPRLDQRDLRGRDQDQLRAVPAVLDLPVAACSGDAAVNAKALVFSVKGEDLLFLDHANARSTTSSAPATPAGAARRARSPRPASSRRRCPDDPSGRPYVTGRTSGVAPFWWTLAEFCRRRAAALRLRRRRGRAQPVHDGRPPGRGAAASSGTPVEPTARCRSRASIAAHLRRSSSSSSPTSSPTTTPAATGPARSPAPARSTRSCAGCGRRSSRCARIVRGDLPGHPGAGG